MTLRETDPKAHALLVMLASLHHETSAVAREFLAEQSGQAQCTGPNSSAFDCPVHDPRTTQPKERCPKCDSPSPEQHPSMQWCEHAFHASPKERTEPYYPIKDAERAVLEIRQGGQLSPYAETYLNKALALIRRDRERVERALVELKRIGWTAHTGSEHCQCKTCSVLHILEGREP